MSGVALWFTRAELREMLSPRSAIFSPTRWRERRSVHDKLVAATERDTSHRLLAGSFKDDRGHIQDLIEGPVDAVTLIHTRKDAVRGNHFHRHTTQFTYILTGCLLMATGGTEGEMVSGDVVVHHPGVPHAWKALEDTDCLVFTQGPRSGDGYESDVVRLDVPLLS